ncbi:NIPSNAP family protein [Stackebrandtia soli]|uniref:NIPSNAP family protein n=1 Tax=Stackebrandtia soli TaxID=1892856 RepID=UPI0039ED4BE1
METDPLGVVELRRYRLHPGRRDTLVELFEREFVESQEELGAVLPGMFRDDDDEDRFVWFRAFADMASRHRMLTTFYGGPTWAAHRDAANATMIDSDDVLLLRPGALTPTSIRPPSTRDGGRDIVAVTVWERGDRTEAEIADWFDQRVRPGVERADGAVLATLHTESSVNDFPALPVTQDPPVFVGVVRVGDRPTYQSIIDADETARAGKTSYLSATVRSPWP